MRASHCSLEEATHGRISVGVLSRCALDGSATGRLQESTVPADDLLVRVPGHLNEGIADEHERLVEATGIDDGERARTVDGTDLMGAECQSRKLLVK